MKYTSIYLQNDKITININMDNDFTSYHFYGIQNYEFINDRFTMFQNEKDIKFITSINLNIEYTFISKTHVFLFGEYNQATEDLISFLEKRFSHSIYYSNGFEKEVRIDD